jgi:WD40 repeat protein
MPSGASGKCALVFSLDGTYLVGGGSDGVLKIWEVATGNLIASLTEHQQRIHTVARCPQTGVIATGSEDTTVKIWDLNTRTCRQTIAHPERQIFTNLSFSPDGRYLASTSLNSQIHLWQTATWTCDRVLDGHQGWCLSTVFAIDSQLLYSGSCDRTVRVWDLSTGENIHTYRGHTNWVWTVAVTADGKLLYSAGEDESILVWDLERCHLDRSLTIDRPYEGTNIGSVSGLPLGQKANLKMLGAIEF